MRLINADALKELFPDSGEGAWTYQGDGVHPNHDYQEKYLSEMIKAFVEAY